MHWDYVKHQFHAVSGREGPKWPVNHRNSQKGTELARKSPQHPETQKFTDPARKAPTQSGNHQNSRTPPTQPDTTDRGRHHRQRQKNTETAGKDTASQIPETARKGLKRSTAQTLAGKSPPQANVTQNGSPTDEPGSIQPPS